MNHTLSDSQLEAMIKSAVNSSGPLPPDEKFSQLISALRELQERRKAALDSEPVAEVLSNRPGNDTSTIDRALPVGTQLYRHAQQPVVPDDVLDALQKVARIRLDLNNFDGDRRGIADCLCDAEEALIEVVNRRAAMLQAERVTTASKLPGVIDDNLVEGLRLLQCMLDDYRERNYGHAQEWVRHIDQRFSEHSEAHGDDAYCILHRLLAGEGDNNSPVIPDGYVMVPKEPTKEMLDEFDSIIDYGAEDSQDAWRRLLAAAPQSPGSETATVPGKWIPVSEQNPDCWCLTCRPVTLNDMRFVVCPDCGNKRCPRANDHRNACTGSNEPGQEGSAYPAAPQEVPDGK